MTPIVIDTDVASAILRERTPEHLAPQLTRQPLAVTFVTVGEPTQWTVVRHWGPQRRARIARSYDRVVVLPYSARFATICARSRLTLNRVVDPGPTTTAGSPPVAQPAKIRWRH